ncbi:DUF3600 domain-containing protein [Brevibacillus fulvus]|uniref:DUF3600 domain-containing protein n=1 Tax=Brevibacillus fulvus TaxID=1125967 RepID=A0A939BRN0_9BACL|nr:DUF3600 domain-containing protein [Brevibacillus fulvus]MBM7589623.1 hypothetical protein [Brevibacillus fulvus]
MNFEEQLRVALQEDAQTLQPPEEWKEKIVSRAMGKRKRGSWKRQLAAGVLAAVFLIPTGAFAYAYLADQLYGSLDAIKHLGATQREYDHLESKLQQAKSTLSAKEFAEFMLLLKDMAYYNVQIADIHGNLHPERLNAADREKYEQILKQLQPYFDKLNSSVD